MDQTDKQISSTEDVRWPNGSEIFYLIAYNVKDPANIGGRIGTEKQFETFNNFDKTIQEYCLLASEYEVSSIEDGLLVLVNISEQFPDMPWARARVAFIYRDENAVDVSCIDYGTEVKVYTPYDIITEVPDEFQEDKMPPIFQNCALNGVKPLSGCWIQRAGTFVEEKVIHKLLMIDIIGFYQGDTIIDIYIDNKLVQDLMVEEGLAMRTNQIQENVITTNTTEATSEVTENESMETGSEVTEKKSSDEEENEISGKESDTLEANTITENTNIKTQEVDTLSATCEAAVLHPVVGESSQKLLVDIKDVPGFDMNNLNRTPPGNITPKEKPNDEFTTLFKGVDTSHAWERSDETIGKGIYKSNLKEMDNVPISLNRLGRGRGRGMSSPERFKKNNSPNRSPVPGRRDVSSDSNERRHRSERREYVAPPRFKRQEQQRVNNLKIVEIPRSRNSSGGSSPDRRVKPGSYKKSELANKMASSYKQEPTEKEMATEARNFLKRDYESESQIIISKVQQVLKKIKDTPIRYQDDDVFAEISDIVFPDKSSLENIPGHKELYICIETMNQAYCDGDLVLEDFVAFCDHLHTAETFSDDLSSILWKYQHNVIKERSTSHQIECYCQLLCQLYNKAQVWESNALSAMYRCLIPSIDKWVLFNKRNMHPNPERLNKVYTQCIVGTMYGIGKSLQATHKSDFLRIVQGIQDKILDAKTERSVRHDLLNCLLSEEMLSQSPRSPERRPVSIETADKGIQAKEVKPTVAVTATNTDSYEGNCDHCKKQKTPVKEDWDPFQEGKKMLQDLKLDELLGKFLENGIRDTLLKIERPDLKSLLKECGIPIGSILEITMFLDRSVNAKSISKVTDESQSNTESIPRITHKSQTAPVKPFEPVSVVQKESVKPEWDYFGENSDLSSDLDDFEDDLDENETPGRKYSIQCLEDMSYVSKSQIVPSADNSHIEEGIHIQPRQLLSSPPEPSMLKKDEVIKNSVTFTDINSNKQRLRKPNTDSIKGIVSEWLNSDTSNPQYVPNNKIETNTSSIGTVQNYAEVAKMSKPKSCLSRKASRSPVLDSLRDGTRHPPGGSGDYLSDAEFPALNAVKDVRKGQSSPVFVKPAESPPEPKKKFGEVQVCAVCGSEFHSSLMCPNNDQYLI